MPGVSCYITEIPINPRPYKSIHADYVKVEYFSFKLSLQFTVPTHVLSSHILWYDKLHSNCTR